MAALQTFSGSFKMSPPHVSARKLEHQKGIHAQHRDAQCAKEGNTDPRIHLSAPPVHSKVLLTQPCRLCIVQHQLFGECNAEIPSVSLSKAKEKQITFFPQMQLLEITRLKKVQNALDSLPEQGSTRTDLKQIRE